MHKAAFRNRTDTGKPVHVKSMQQKQAHRPETV